MSLFRVITIREKNERKTIKSGLTKSEADKVKSEWENLFKDAYHPPVPKVKIEPDHGEDK